MAIQQTTGLGGRKIIVQPSKIHPGMVCITIQGRDGLDNSAITLDAQTANLFANCVEVEAVNAFALELAGVA